MKKNVFLVATLGMVLALSLLIVGCDDRKKYTFYLENSEDYISYSSAPFEQTAGNAWSLKDPANYKQVLKELQQVFGASGSDYSFAKKDKPKVYQAQIGFFKDDNNDDLHHIVLEVGSVIKSGGESWSWIVSDSDFEKGRYALNLYLSPDEYRFKMWGF
jgi:hypothetical protein